MKNFKDVYENCNLHRFKYTEKVFLKDLTKNITDIIEIDNNYIIPSASIAQVYKGTLLSSRQEVAIKVTHPELENQIVFPFLYYYIYSYITTNFKFFYKYKIPFDLSAFFNNLIKQIDMSYEANNLTYFYNQYANNPLVCIPKPIISSKNILIMEYIEGKDFENNNLSNYEKYKYILLLNLFLRNNLITLDKSHGDLHTGNWKIIKTGNLEKIVIYDFGFCINISNDYKLIIHNLDKSIETNNQILFANSVYNYLERSCSKDLFLKDFDLFIKSNNKNINIANYIEFCINKNYVFKSELLDLVLSSSLVNNYFQTYTTDENIENNIVFDDNEIIRKLQITSNHLMTLSAICDINNCYHDLNKYLKDFINENTKDIIKIKQKSITNNKINKRNKNNNYIEL